MKTLDTSLAAMISATAPLFLTLFDYFVNGIKFKRSTLFAILLGISGVIILIYKGSLNASYDFHIITYFLGLLAFSFGSAFSRKLELPKNTVLNSALQMYFTGIVSFLIFFVLGNKIPVLAITLASWIALAYLAIFGGIGMLAYIYLIKHEPLSRVSSYTFVNAIGATILGQVIGEKLSVNFFIASPMIFVALLIILRSKSLLKTPATEAK
jgi:drug/metabolite transporter (DMT)-like permease